MPKQITDGPELPKNAHEIRAEQLFDLAVRHPQGFTRVDVESELGWDNTRLSQVARTLRETLRNDTITLTCDPQGQREPWLYRLVGTPADASKWVKNRLKDTETRLATMKHVAESIGGDRRSVEGGPQGPQDGEHPQLSGGRACRHRGGLRREVGEAPQNSSGPRG